jgi:hypothetical protein
MSIGKIIQMVGLLVAVVTALVTIPQAALLIALLGLVGGYYIAADDRILFLVATVALVTVAGSLGGIPAVGMHLTSILSNMGALFSAAAVAVILVMTYERMTQ